VVAIWIINDVTAIPTDAKPLYNAIRLAIGTKTAKTRSIVCLKANRSCAVMTAHANKKIADSTLLFMYLGF
jgi:hypothetical protein